MRNDKKSWHPFMNIRDVLLNVKNKLYIWFLNKFIAKEDEFYGFTEPSYEWMTLHNKKIWIQPCNEGEMK